MGNIRAPISDTYPNLAIKLFVTPSMSPVYMNKPAYTIIDLRDSDFSLKDMDWRYFDILTYMITRLTFFSTISPHKKYRLNLNSLA